MSNEVTQDEISNQNRIAWEAQSYQAWIAAYGTPDEAARKLVRAPAHKLRRILPYLEYPKGQKIANPLGSHGRIAVALALLGADVTVFDISGPNKRYATELAESANVEIEYLVGDFLILDDQQHEQFDWVVMELGVLHYFSDLDKFVQVLKNLLKPNGKVILNELHPLLKKAIEVGEDGVTLVGDYFSKDLEQANTPYDIHLIDQIITQCLIRR